MARSEEISFADAHQLARKLGGQSLDAAYDAPWNQSVLSNVIYTTKAEPMSYNAGAVLK